MSDQFLMMLSRYVLKSGQGEHYSRRGQTLPLDALGIARDRELMLVDSKGGFMSQRRDPKLAQICYEIGSGVVVFRAPGMAALEILDGENSAAAAFEAGLHKDKVRVQPVREQADQWFAEFLGKPGTLVRRAADWNRPANALFVQNAEQVGMQDGFPLHLLGEGSLQLLGEKLGETAPILNFRPNLVVSGTEPHAEDRWKRIRIGEVEFDVVKPCERCSIPSTDQSTGARMPKVGKALASYRRNGIHLPLDARIDEGAILFGQNLVHRSHGAVLRVGDRVEVLEEI